MTIVTGRHPHVRAQLWWRLVDAERDGAAIKALCSGIGLALGGDSTVSNPSRVLRLGGSIAWPVKPGRIRETTEVHIPEDGRPPDYWAATLAKSFAAPAPLLNAAPKSPEQSAPPSTPASAAPKPLDLPISSLSVEATLAAIQRNDRWHQNAVRLVGNWVARGLSDAEILSFAPALTIGRAADGRSYTPDQTRQQLASMIIGARRKWNVPNPQIAIDDKLTIPPLDIEWEDGAHAAMIPRRRWLVGSFAIRGHLTVLVAPPGAGKSTLGIALAVAGITGRWPRSSAKPFTRPSRRGSGTMKTTATNCAAALARDHAAMERRARRSALAKLGLDSGSERPLVIAKATKDGAVVRLPDIEAIIERVQAEGIGLLIVDPFVETHEVDENNNAQIKAVAAMWREVAQAAAIARLSSSTTPASRRRLRPMRGRDRFRPRAARRRRPASRGSCARSSPCRRATPTSSGSMRTSAANGCGSMMRRRTCRLTVRFCPPRQFKKIFQLSFYFVVKQFRDEIPESLIISKSNRSLRLAPRSGDVLLNRWVHPNGTQVCFINDSRK